MATSALDDLEEFITCEVCLNLFESRDPRLLLCSHAFCRSCIQNIQDASSRTSLPGSDQIRCPKCQRVSPIPTGSLNALPAYHQANQVRDILGNVRSYMQSAERTHSTVGRDHTQCVSCNQRQAAVAYCFTCGKSLCDRCQSGHKTNRQFKSHEAVPVSRDQIRALVCPEHNQLVEVFCLDCRRTLCSACRLSTHAAHTARDLCSQTSVAADYDLHVHQYQLKQSEHRLGTIQTKFNGDIQALRASLAERKQHLLGQIEQQDMELRRQLDNYQNIINMQLEGTKGDIHRSRGEMSSIAEARATVLRPISLIESVGLKSVASVLKELKSDFPRTEFPVVPPRGYDFYAGSEHVALGYLALRPEHCPSGNILESIETFPPAKPIPKQPATFAGNRPEESGSRNLASPLKDEVRLSPENIALEVSGPDHSPRLMTSGDRSPRLMTSGSHHSPRLMPSSDHSPRLMSSGDHSPRLMTSGDHSPRLMTSGDHSPRLMTSGSHHSPRQMIIGPASDIVPKWSAHMEQSVSCMAFFGNGDLIVCTNRCQCLSFERGEIQPLSFDASRMGRVRGIAAHHPSSAVVLTQWSTFTLFTVDADRWSSAATWVGGATGPIGFTSKGDIIVCSKAKSSNTISRFGRDGTIVWQKNTDHNSVSLVADWEDRIITSDGQRIRTYSRDGSDITAPDSQFVHIKHAGNLCVDSNNNILMADRDRKVVRKFDPEGKDLGVVLKTDGQLTHLALYQDRHLVIATDDHCVAMYDI